MATYTDGDMLVDNKTWNVYQRTNGSWSLMGNIKGEKGDDGSSLLCGGYCSKISPIVNGDTFQFSITAFNRTPEVGERFTVPGVTETGGEVINYYWIVCEVTSINQLIATVKVAIISTINHGRLYEHNISWEVSGAFSLSFKLINKRSSAYTVDALKSLQELNSQNKMPINGVALYNTTFEPVFYMQYVSATLYACGFNGVLWTYALSNETGFKDNVISLLK